MGENPPAGAMISYFLESEPAGEITLALEDRQGRPVRSFSSRERLDLEPAPSAAPIDVPVRLTARKGLNRVAWNLRYAPPRTVPGVLLFWHSPIYPPVGPMAVPGTYQVKLTVGEAAFVAPLEVRPDPRVSATAEDLEAQFRLHLEMRD